MSIDFSIAQWVNSVCENENELLRKTTDDVGAVLKMQLETPTTDSLAVAYGAMSGLAFVYMKNGCAAIAGQILSKMEPMLYHLIQRCDTLSFEQIYILIAQLTNLGDYNKARKVSSKCIELILKRSKYKPTEELRVYETKLRESFFQPIDERELMVSEILDLTRQWEVQTDWLKQRVFMDAFTITEQSFISVQMMNKDNIAQLTAVA